MLIGFDKAKKADAGAGKAAEPGALISDGTTATFMQDVIEESMKQPVLVDFWAPWCGPCKQFGPVIEAAVTAARGKMKLVKIDIDQNPEIPGQMGVQSIPAVFAFAGGRPVDGFMGAKPEGQIKEFIDKILKNHSSAVQDVEQTLSEAEALLGQGDFEGAGALYQSVLEAEPDQIAAFAGLGMTVLRAGRPEEAKTMLESLDEEASKTPAVVRLAAAIKLFEKIGPPKPIAPLREAVESNPDDHTSRFDLALAEASSGQEMAAVESLVAIVGRDPEWEEGKAKQQLLEFFEVWGPKHPVTSTGRRKLSAVLFR